MPFVALIPKATTIPMLTALAFTLPLPLPLPLPYVVQYARLPYNACSAPQRGNVTYEHPIEC